MANENETKYDEPVFHGRRPVEIAITVYPRRIVVTADGKTIIQWQGSDQRMTIPTKNGKAANRVPAFFLTVPSYRISKLTFTDLSDSAGSAP